jgi:hypothetical protein
MRAAITAAWLDHRRRARYAVRVLPARRPWPVVARAVVLGSATGYVVFTGLLRLWSALAG